MQKIRILPKNLADYEFSNGGNSGSPNFLTNFAVGMMYTPTERGKVARTDGLVAGQNFRTFFTDEGKANMIALTRTNFRTATTVRGVLFDSSGSPQTTLHDTGSTAGFDATGLDTDIDDYTELDFEGYRNWVNYFTLTSSNVRELLMEWSDASHPDGYLQSHRLWLGKYFEFGYHVPFGGMSTTPMDDSKGDRAGDGTHVVSRGWRARKITLDLSLILDADLPSVLALVRRLGKYHECWLDCFPDQQNARGIYNRGAFRLVDSPAFNPHQVGLHKSTLTFEET